MAIDPSAAFVSYSRADQDFALRLAMDLKKEGAKVWMDQLDVRHGQRWDRAIEDAVKDCPRMLVILSPDSVSSENVMDEVAFALEKRKQVIPVFYRECEIPFRLRRIQYVDFRRDERYSSELQELVKTMSATVEPPSETQLAGTEPETAQPAPQPEPLPSDYYVGDKPKLRYPRWLKPGAVICVIALFAGLIYWRWPLSKPSETAAQPTEHKAGDTSENPKDGQTYVWIPPGKFIMGCSPDSPVDFACLVDEKPAHEVRISKWFRIGMTLVTVGAWKKYLLKLPPYNDSGDKNMPVVGVTWDQAKSFCDWAGGRLPTEAEWEYAARAGNTASRYGDVDDIAWYAANSRRTVHPVGQKRPNALHLYDMLGNVFQWVGDWYDANYYGNSAAVDPTGPATGTKRVLRCCSSHAVAIYVRVSERASKAPSERDGTVGLRCVLE